jgi:hypothetical protein
MTMITAHNAHRPGGFLATFLLAAVLGGSTSQAGVIVGLIVNPSSTAGGGATSTRSGGASWQLYALDDSNTDFGISSYNISMSGTVAINHRAPVTTINDGNGDPKTAGFNLLRTGTNVNPIQGSQGLPGSTPFQIMGFGQTASDFVTKSTAIDAGAVVVGPTISGAWGNYNSPVLSSPTLLIGQGYPAAAAAVAAGKKWVFLAEGLGFYPQITSAVFSVFSNQSGTSAAATVSTVCLCDADLPPKPMVSSTTINNVNANVPGSVTYTFSADQPVTWSGFSFVSGSSTGVPATFNPTTGNFSWNTVGSPIGSYKWSVQASNPYGTATGFVTVNITVPEPATLLLVGLALLGPLSASRYRPSHSRV